MTVQRRREGVFRLGSKPTWCSRTLPRQPRECHFRSWPASSPCGGDCLLSTLANWLWCSSPSPKADSKQLRFGGMMAKQIPRYLSESYLIKKVMERNEMATLGKIVRALSECALAFRLACGSCGLWPHNLVVLCSASSSEPLPSPAGCRCPLVRPGAQHLVVYRWCTIAQPASPPKETKGSWRNSLGSVWACSSSRPS